MPRAFLKDQNRTTSEMNRLANFAIISAADNKTLGGVAPSSYKDKMATKSLDQILDAVLCPVTLFDDNYDVFLQERAARLRDYASDLVSLEA